MIEGEHEQCLLPKSEGRPFDERRNHRLKSAPIQGQLAFEYGAVLRNDRVEDGRDGSDNRQSSRSVDIAGFCHAGAQPVDPKGAVWVQHDLYHLGIRKGRKELSPHGPTQRLQLPIARNRYARDAVAPMAGRLVPKIFKSFDRQRLHA